jgi:hypothetical protein
MRQTLGGESRIAEAHPSAGVGGGLLCLAVGL